MTKIAINGFGRIGRLLFKIINNDPQYVIAAINDSALNSIIDPEHLIYLLKNDINNRINDVSYNGEEIVVNGKKVKLYAYDDIARLPWNELDIDQVFECTGESLREENCIAHIMAGAKSVVCYSHIIDEPKAVIYSVNDNMHDIEKQNINIEIDKINDNVIILNSGVGKSNILSVQYINEINGIPEIITEDRLKSIGQILQNEEHILNSINNFKSSYGINNDDLRIIETGKVKQKKYFDNHMINQKINKSTLIYRKRG